MSSGTAEYGLGGWHRNGDLVGHEHSLALDANGDVWAWGADGEDQLGDGTTNDLDSGKALKVVVLSDVIAIAAGGEHSLALRNDGTVWAWGSNQFGELGQNTLNLSFPVVICPTATPSKCATPLQVLGPDGETPLSDVVAISAGFDFSVALKEDGTVWTWGTRWTDERERSVGPRTQSE